MVRKTPKTHLVTIKGNTVVTSAVRNTSCSRGWLRITIECTFGLITVFSFILIVLMSIKSNHLSIASDSTCIINGCTVHCEKVTYSAKLEEDIVSEISSIEAECDYRFIILQEVQFPNSTLPTKWLNGLRLPIYGVFINGGNLNDIAPGAFKTLFGSTVKRLVLFDVVITEWGPEMLDGLSQLFELQIDESWIGKIHHNALAPVRDTLNRLIIDESGNWDPKYLTGSTENNFTSLQSVIFSNSNFGDILGKDSFSQLSNCNILYLDRCEITAIDAHAFDNLEQLRILNLASNHLSTLPIGLFDTIINNNVNHIAMRPQIYVHDNKWVCDCNQIELLRLVNAGMLAGNPYCYHSQIWSKISLVQLGLLCADKSTTFPINSENKSVIQEIISSPSDNVYANGSCNEYRTTGNGASFVSPIDSLSCSASILPHVSRSIKDLGDEHIYRHRTNLISPTFAIQVNNDYMIEITSNYTQAEYGLVWYQSKCPLEIYCLNTLPYYLRIYNLNEQSLYTFCPLLLRSGTVDSINCISYTSNFMENSRFKKRWLFLVFTGIGFLVLGATAVYTLIQKYPALLKGNKRILFVKHKKVDALVLPPKVPLRPGFLDEKEATEFNENKIFTVSNKTDFQSKQFLRTMSMRSTKSSAPSYISALEPTESQLVEWRLNNLDNLFHETSDDSSLYYSVSGNSFKSLDVTYERL